MATLRPVAVDPVNCTKSTFARTAAPVPPSPVATASTGGAPISVHPRTNSTALSGVTSDGFNSTEAPAASAGNTSTAGMRNGKFHGVITPTRGYGRCTVVRRLVRVSRLCALGWLSARNASALRAQ